jgi:hypothetical protein
MAAPPHLSARRERGAALIIVLAFVVLLTGLMVAYLSRTTSDRQVAQVSFTQTKADQVAASGMDLVIGALRQEITGPSPTPTPPYVPAANANMLPVRFGNPPGSPDPIPNLVRRSVRADNTIPAPGISSLASTVNSTTDVSANGRFVTSTRWNSHYLVPKKNTGTDDSIPIDAFTAATPDWVILTRNGAVAFSTWNSALADQTPTNNSYAVGRYAYAVYDEGQLLDANVAGYPTDPSAAPTPAQRVGRKGPVTFADLTTLPYPIPQSQIDKIAGWRNYGSIQATAAFGTFPTFTFTSAFATNYINNFVLFNTTGFSRANGAVSPTNGRTDQMFLSRKELIAFRATTQFSSNALQYLTTFSRELNAPSWKPSTPAGSSINYAALANNATSVNRDLLNVRVPAGSPGFTRADGTTANANDLLIKQRFPLSRINGLGPTGVVTTDSNGNPLNSTINKGFLVLATDPNSGGGTISRDFGLHWNSDHWDYVGATGTTVQNTIATLDTVAGQNREPNFFELLKAGILSGSVGLGSSGATFVAAETKYYNANPATPPTSSDYQIFQIGANIINQWNSGNIPIFFNFGGNELAGIKNLPYLNKLVFKPYWTLKAGKYHFDAWLIPSLWNPHQNALGSQVPVPAEQDVRIVMTAGTLSATTVNPTFTTALMTNIPGGATQFMTVNASSYGTSPSAPIAIVKPPNPPSTITQSSDITAPAGGYYGFHINNLTDVATPVPGASTTAQPILSPACTFQLQVDVTGKGNWKAYQTWTGCANSTPLICSPTGLAGITTLQDPEFVTLDPRTLRFGVWGNAAKQSLVPADYTDGTQGTLDWPTPRYELITALPPTPVTNFTLSTLPYALYNYANNPTSSTVYYTDSDTLRRQGDIISGTTTAMLPTDFTDRPQILSRPFQSLAELGQVFRDQPWKTLDFTTASSPDVGLLDVFTLHESANEAGKTSLNTRYKVILTAILSNAIKRLAGAGTDVINSTQRNNIVTALFNITSASPMIRKTDLLAQLAADPSVTGLGNKEARELVMRAFSDATQTRTWNLMIDVIAQSGRYPTSANSLAGFLVEGEQHYWVHVAIDRFTGQVVDKQIEVVNE